MLRLILLDTWEARKDLDLANNLSQNLCVSCTYDLPLKPKFSVYLDGCSIKMLDYMSAIYDMRGYLE